MVRRARPATAPVPAGQPGVPGGPVRTCIGCRKRVAAFELLRFVAIERLPGQFSVVPDPARRRPGRGAHVHPDLVCLETAQRRRAFGRSLRVTGVVDTGELAEAVAAEGRPSGATKRAARTSGPHPAAQSGRTDGGSVQPHPDTAR